VKNHNIANNSTTTKAREKLSTDLESLEFSKFSLHMFGSKETMKFYLIKFTTNFYRQAGYLQGERS